MKKTTRKCVWFSFSPRRKVTNMSESTQTRSHSVATPSSSWIPFERRSGTTVYDRAGRCLGSIQNAMIDRNSGQLAYVVRVLNRSEHGIATQSNASAEDDDNLAVIVEKALESSREWLDFASQFYYNRRGIWADSSALPEAILRPTFSRSPPVRGTRCTACIIDQIIL